MANELKQAPTQDSFDDIEERYAPGETVGSSSSAAMTGEYGDKNEKIPEKYQIIWKDLVTKIQLKDQFARIEETKRAADGGFYWRNIFDAYWSDLQFTYLQAGGPGSNNNAAGLNYPLNIYQARGRAFMKIVGHKPDIHFVASGESATAYRVAEAANTLLEHIENLNDTITLAQDFARIAWTDGRYGIYTRWVADGARFGYYDEDADDMDSSPEGIDGGSENPPTKKPRRPKGGEVMSIYGVPWLKVPINMRNQHEFAWLVLSDEIDLSAAKSLYPDIAKKIQVGEPGPGEYMFDRTTRIALTQGLHLVSQMAEAVDQLPTLQTIWVRPCIFAEIEDKECREWFEDTYPNGGKVVFLGNEYAESCNESMDDHWSIGHAVRGHGQSTPSYGYSMLTDQDAFNDCFDLVMETHMRAIPAIYMDPQVFDMPAYSKERAMPGARYPLKHDIDPNVNVQQKFMVEPQVQVSEALIKTVEMLSTTMPSVITGISPAAVGEADENNTTLGGISILRAASRGEAGTAFKGWIEAYSRACEQAVRIGAKYRMAEADDSGIYTLPRAGRPDAMIDLVELYSSNIWAKTDTDQDYPSTFEERQMALTQLTMAAQMGDEQAKMLLNDPSNAEELARLRGIPNLKSSAGYVGMKVKDNIDLLLQQQPQPIQEAVQALIIASTMAKAQGQPLPEPNKYQLFKSSMQPGPLDNAAAELVFYQTWYNSPAGQQSRFDNPKGFFNVELYALNLQQIAQKNAEQAQMMAIKPQAMIEQMKKAPQAKHPSEQINFKDLGSSGKIQLAAQAGIDVTADEAGALTEEHMTPPSSSSSSTSPRKLKRA